MASFVAYISASAELNAVSVWRLDVHAIGPPARKVMNPEMERLWCRGSSGGGVFEVGRS